MAWDAVLAEIDSLDPQVDAERICFLSTNHDFPWDVEQSLSLAFFKTYSIPTISELLDRTGEFQQRAQKRYDDTKLILSEILDAGFDSERGREATRRMNRMHGRFAISNDDYLYVLSTLVLEPIRWNERWGWRRYTDKEARAHLEYWRELGRRMSIRDIPSDIGELERWSRSYEAARLRFAGSNRRVADHTLNMFLSWYPSPLRRFVRLGILGLLEDAVLDAFGYAHPPRWLRMGLDLGLRVRATVLRFLPRRSVPRLLSRQRMRTYRFGHRLADLGVPGLGPSGQV
jgi:hypothetical protein